MLDVNKVILIVRHAESMCSGGSLFTSRFGPGSPTLVLATFFIVNCASLFAALNVIECCVGQGHLMCLTYSYRFGLFGPG